MPAFYEAYGDKALLYLHAVKLPTEGVHLPGLLHRYEQARTSVPVPAGVAEPSSLARFAGSSAIRAAHALAAKRLRLEARADRIEEEMDGLRAALVARRGARAHPKAD